MNITYKELRDKLSTLTEEQLNQPVKVAPLGQPFVDVSELWIVEEDYIIISTQVETGQSQLAHTKMMKTLKTSLLL